MGRVVAAVATVQWNLEQVLERPDGLRVDVHVVACTPARPTTYTYVIIAIIIIIRSFINDITHIHVAEQDAVEKQDRRGSMEHLGRSEPHAALTHTQVRLH